MSNDMENNRRVCQMEKEAREKRLLLYAEAIQKSTLEVSMHGSDPMNTI